MSKNGSRLLALLGLGALAFWRYKKATPEEKQKVNDLVNTAKENLSKVGEDLKNKANELKGQVENKMNEFKNQTETKIDDVQQN